MKRNKALFMILPMIATFALTSCGGSGPAPFTEQFDMSTVIDENGKIRNQTTITLWSTTGSSTRPAVDAFVAEFEAANPTVKVNNVYQSGSYSDLQNLVTTGFSANNFPDLVVAYPDHVADYLDYGRAYDLRQMYYDETIGLSAEDEADYIASFMAEGTGYSQEGIYSLPWCKSTELMYYNENLIHGLNLSAYDATINNGNALSREYIESLTWDELFDKLCPALERYNAANNNSLYNPTTGGILGYDSDDNLFITLAEQYGYDYTSVDMTTGIGSIDFENDNMKAVMRKFHDAAAKKYVFTKGTNGGDYVNEVFTTGGCVFSIGSTGGVGYQFSTTNPMNVTAARIPQADTSNPKTILQGPSMVVLDHGSPDRLVASWLLWKTLTSAENAVTWSMASGYMGVRHSVYTNEEYLATNDVSKQAANTSDRLRAISNTTAASIVDETFTSPVFKGSAAARNAVSGLVTQILGSDATGETLTTLINTTFSDAKNQALNAL